jgi:hypothetical protein
VGSSLPEAPAGQAGASAKKPLSFEWKSDVFGDKEKLAFYATFAADLKAHAAYKKGGEITAIAELKGGAWILNHDVSLLHAMAIGKARANGLEQGSFEWKVSLALGGHNVYTAGKPYAEKGPASTSQLPDLDFTKDWPLPPIEFTTKFPLIDPVVLDLKVGVKGGFKFGASVKPEASLESAKVSLSLTPHAEFSAYASAAASVPAVAKAGVDCNLNLLTLDLPTTAALELKLIDKSPFQLTETLTSELKGNTLKGELVAFAEVDANILKAIDKVCDTGASVVNWFGQLIADKDVVPKCKIELKRLEKPLLKWDGFNLGQKLLDVKAEQSPFSYGSYGAGTPAKPALSTPLNLYWSGARQDNFITATAEGTADAASAGYGLVRAEGRLLTKHCPRTIPLRSYFSSQSGDNLAVATAAGQSTAQAAGYSPVRIEGYIYEKPEPKTVPLKLYWSAARGDYATVASPEAEKATEYAGYKFVRIEGYVLLP